MRAFDTNGKQFGATNLRADVTIRADASGLAEYEVLSRIDLKPGRYQLRTAANVGSLATTGSLYYDVVVPDFMDPPLSLSALVLSSPAAPIVAPRDGLKTLIPVVPTTKRTFRPSDQASAFLRVYQGGNKPIAAVPLRIQLRNDADVLVFDRREEVGVATFSTCARRRRQYGAAALAPDSRGILADDRGDPQEHGAPRPQVQCPVTVVRTRPRGRRVRLRRRPLAAQSNQRSRRRSFDPAWIWSTSTSRCSTAIAGR